MLSAICHFDAGTYFLETPPSLFVLLFLNQQTVWEVKTLTKKSYNIKRKVMCKNKCYRGFLNVLNILQFEILIAKMTLLDEVS